MSTRTIDKIADGVRLLSAVVAVAVDPSLQSSLRSAPLAYDALKRIAASAPRGVRDLVDVLVGDSQVIFSGTPDLPPDAAVLYAQMVEIGMVGATEVVAAGMNASAITDVMLCKLTDPEHTSPEMRGLFRRITEPVLARMLGDGLIADELRAAFMQEVLRQLGDLGGKLDEIGRLTRLELIALGDRFEISNMHRLSDKELREALEKRAEDWRSLRRQIDAIDERTVGLANLKSSARDAASRLDLSEVERILSIVDEVESEISAETKALRAENALLRGRPLEAFDHFSAAAEAVANIGPLESGIRRLAYAKRLIAHGEKYGDQALSLSETMINQALSRVSVQISRELRADLTNALGTSLLSQARHRAGSGQKELLTKAVAALKETILLHGSAAPAVVSAEPKNNLGIALRQLGHISPGWIGNDYLRMAVSFSREAVDVYYFAGLHEKWAESLNTRGNALEVLGKRLGGRSGFKMISDAAEDYRLALGALDRKKQPIKWAMLVHNFAILLVELGRTIGGVEGATLVQNAIDAWSQVIDVRSGGAHPVQWANAVHQIALAHAALAENETCNSPGVELSKAVARLKEALTVYEAERFPNEYARVTADLVRMRACRTASALDAVEARDHVDDQCSAGERQMELKAPPPSPIKDATEATFMADVIEASMEVPVIVDFWAPWCGPCKTLGPALEKAVTEAKGKVRLVKIDVDQNQRIAAQMRVQSIPAVFGFVGGQPVDGFMGAQAPAQIKAFVDRLVEMSGGNAGLEEAIAAAEEMLAEGAAADAAQTFAAILQEEEGNVAALAGLARSYLALGETERARSILDLAPKGKESDPAIAAARAQIELAEASAGAGEAGALVAALERDPDDHQARYDLAMAQVGGGDSAAAIDTLLELFRRDREWNEGAARAQLFKLFDSLGPKSEAAQKGRRRLSSMIFA